MTSGMHSKTESREAGVWTATTLLSMVLFFAGCACFTFADIFLGSNDRASLIFAIVGIPLFLVGGVALMIRIRSN